MSKKLSVLILLHCLLMMGTESVLAAQAIVQTEDTAETAASNDASALHAASQIFETDEISSLLPFVDKHTLVVFDVDYTLFRSRTNLGTPEWIFYLIKKEREQGLSRDESFRKIYPIWMRAQKFNEIELMDPKIPKLLQELKKKSLGYIALTSRQPDAAEITAWQLNKFAIDFGLSKLADVQFMPQFKSPVLYDKGLLFAHDFNEKGAVLAAFIEEVRVQLGKQKDLHRVIFIDDTKKDLFTVQKAIEELGLEFVAFRYSAGDAYKKQFTPKLVETEKQILMSNHSDSEIRLMLENAGSYADSSGVMSGSDREELSLRTGNRPVETR